MEFKYFRCLDCGFNGEITMEEISRHRAQCALGTTEGIAEPAAPEAEPRKCVNCHEPIERVNGFWTTKNSAFCVAGNCLHEPEPPAVPPAQEPQLRRCNFEGMTWPFPNHNIGWRMRYAPQTLTPQELMWAAGELDAYAALIQMPQKRRNKICAQIQKGPNA